jgi:hypothetical protein
MQDLERIAYYELIETINEARVCLDDHVDDAKRLIFMSRARINSLLLYGQIDYYIRIEAQRKVTYYNPATIEYPTLFRMAMEK